MWLQHDGCLAHYARRVREALNEIYLSQWIGRPYYTIYDTNHPSGKAQGGTVIISKSDIKRHQHRQIS
ncbi:hypothetical protein WH47_02357 [Habropoda laboriosa]|uniref:Uncharacterized protein n=1 Tax=Habropoda laboriosa TaxID=597456 RepID=A0A0L7RKD3_9HYME|nr:hypothetical protein WH47_02357 [Habropoda laboriosa]